jgi:hypothetical protein
MSILLALDLEPEPDPDLFPNFQIWIRPDPDPQHWHAIRLNGQKFHFKHHFYVKHYRVEKGAGGARATSCLQPPLHQNDAAPLDFGMGETVF